MILYNEARCPGPLYGEAPDPAETQSRQRDWESGIMGVSSEPYESSEKVNLPRCCEFSNSQEADGKALKSCGVPRIPP